MSPERDERIDVILGLLMRLAQGDLGAQAPHSGRGDELDAVIEGINMLAEELSASAEELRQATERLLRQEKLAAMGELCGGVAHELRNPLAAIRNGVFFLKMTMPSAEPEAQETLAILDREVNNCERLIRDLLDFARPTVVHRSQVDVNALLATVLTGVSIPPHIRVDRVMGSHLPAVLGDRDQLGQAFTNLVRNAIQAMPRTHADARLTVRSESTGSHVLVHVSDTGPGIPEHQQARIFEPLYTTKAKGIGLGLAVARSVVERHGGTVELDSQPGQGTTFLVWLPLDGMNGG